MTRLDSRLNEIAVSDRATLACLTQFAAMSVVLPRQTAEWKRDRAKRLDIGGVCDNLWQAARKPLILKRRDVRVVEGARLESDSGDTYRARSKHFFAQSIQRLAALKYSSM